MSWRLANNPAFAGRPTRVGAVHAGNLDGLESCPSLLNVACVLLIRHPFQKGSASDFVVACLRAKLLLSVLSYYLFLITIAHSESRVRLFHLEIVTT